MIGFAAARLMEGGLTGAAWSENGPERLNQRNGYPGLVITRGQALYASGRVGSGRQPRPAGNTSSAGSFFGGVLGR